MLSSRLVGLESKFPAVSAAWITMQILMKLSVAVLLKRMDEWSNFYLDALVWGILVHGRRIQDDIWDMILKLGVIYHDAQRLNW